MVIAWLVERFFGALHAIGLAPAVPVPFDDRLAKLDPSQSSIDNDIYNTSSFDWSKSGLELLNPVRVGYFMDKLHRYVSSLPSHSASEVITILDLGCGSGIAIEAIHSSLASSSQRAKVTEDGLSDGKRTYRLIGLDMSDRSIELGRKRASESHLAIEYIVGDIYDLPLAPNSVDGIICSDVLEHLFDLPRAFSSISRCLKPGGFFTFDTINRTPVSYYLTIWILQDILKAMQGDAHDHRLYVRPQEVHEVMRKAALKQGPEHDLVGMRPGVQLPPVAIWRLLSGQGFVMSFLAKFVETSDLSISYLHWCEKPRDEAQ